MSPRSLGLELGVASGQSGAVPLEETELFTDPLDDTGTFDNYTFAVVLEMDDENAPDSPGAVTFIEISIEGAVGAVYIGTQAGSGDAYDATSLTQVFFGGNAGVDPDDATTVTTSDRTAFTWNGTDNLIFSIWSGTTNAKSRSNFSAPSYFDSYIKVGANEADTPDKSGYSSVGAVQYVVRSLTVYG